MTAIKPKVPKKDGTQREGKGFSREEIEKAGTNLKDAIRLGVSVDTRRKTAHEENVEALKTFLQTKKIASKPKKKSKS